MGIVTKCISQVAVETEQCILLMRLCIMFHLTHFALNAGNMSHIYPFVLIQISHDIRKSDSIS